MKKFLKIIFIFLAAAGVGLVLFILGYWATFKSNLWIHYPQPLKADIALTKLEILDISNLICHEDCQAEKQFDEKMIGDYLWSKGLDGSFGKKIKEKILDEKENSSTRQDLVYVLSAYEKKKSAADPQAMFTAPQYLTDYLSSSSGNHNVKTAIISQFGSDEKMAQAAVKSLLGKITNTSLSADERLPAMLNLINLIDDSLPNTTASSTAETKLILENAINYPSVCDYLLIVAHENGDQRLRYMALNNLICTDYQQLYSEKIFNELQDMLFNGDNQLAIQELLVQLLNGYHIVDKDKTIAMAKKVYQDQKFGGMVHYIAYNILKGYGIKGYPEPEVSAEELNDDSIELGNLFYYPEKNK
jgi:hypothetical protein